MDLVGIFHRVTIPGYGRVKFRGGANLGFATGNVPRLVISCGPSLVTDIWQGQSLPTEEGNGNCYLQNPYSCDAVVTIVRGERANFRMSSHVVDWRQFPSLRYECGTANATASEISARNGSSPYYYIGQLVRSRLSALRVMSKYLATSAQAMAYTFPAPESFDVSAALTAAGLRLGAVDDERNAMNRRNAIHPLASFLVAASEAQIGAIATAAGSTPQKMQVLADHGIRDYIFDIPPQTVFWINREIASSTSRNFPRCEVYEIGRTAEECVA